MIRERNMANKQTSWTGLIVQYRYVPMLDTHSIWIGRANGLSETYIFRIRGRNGWSLYFLAQSRDIHCLPATVAFHNGKELGCRFRGIHVRSNIRVIDSALLEDTNAVVVITQAVMWVIKWGWYNLIGEDLKTRLLECQREIDGKGDEGCM